MSMATTLSLYNTTGSHQFRDMVRAAKPTSQKTVIIKFFYNNFFNLYIEFLKGVEVGIEASASPLPSVVEEDQPPDWHKSSDENNEKQTTDPASKYANLKL